MVFVRDTEGVRRVKMAIEFSKVKCALMNQSLVGFTNLEAGGAAKPEGFSGRKATTSKRGGEKKGEDRPTPVKQKSTK